MFKKAILLLFTSSFVISWVSFWVITEVNCNTYSSSITSDCNQCFDGGYIYEKKAKIIWDSWDNGTSYQNIYFKDENEKVIRAVRLDENTDWTITNPFVKYPDSFIWYTSNSWRLYHIFEANKDGQEYLEPADWAGLTLESVEDGANPNSPAIKLEIISNYHNYKDWNLWPKITHTECIFYKPAWCGDGIVESDQWEECDPNASGYDNTNCSSSCQIITDTTYDLALIKQVVNPQISYSRGDTVTFSITVFNQWRVDAKDIQIVDYMANWFELADSNWTADWDKAFYTITDTIAPWDTKTVNITLKIKDDVSLWNLVNWAEISNDNWDDIDSTPDTDRANDCHWGDGPAAWKPNTIDPSEDNDINWKGDQDHDGICEEWEDEDDHDPALIQVWTYDLALRKTIVDPKDTYQVWDTVTFKIEVFNQGEIDADNIQIVDYVPEWLELIDDTWSYDVTGRRAYKNIDHIAPGGSAYLTITMKIVSASTNPIVNAAEISRDNGNDCDSTADDINWNTPWEVPPDLIDDDIGDGCNPWGDEDDHDIASITVEDMPACWTANWQTYGSDVNDWPEDVTFCDPGTPDPDPVPFPSVGETVTWTCNLDDKSVTCSASRSTTPTSLCWTANWQTLSSDTTSWPDGLTFCTVWDPNPNPVPFPSEWQTVTWTCSDGTITSTCSASRASAGWGGGWWYYCWDGLLNAWNVPYEECDAWSNNGNETYKITPDWDSIISYYESIGLTERANQIREMEWSEVYCSTDCKLVPIETPCAIDGTCEAWSCWILNWKPITPQEYETFINYINNLDSYRQYFCDPADSMLSFGMNQTLWASEFVWYCGTTRCSMPVVDTEGVIKIYGSYINPWSCPECMWFDVETDDYIRRTFLSNYDTEYTRSIMQGDYLPIWFTLTNYDQYVWQCNENNVGKYNFAQFNVKFTIDGLDKSFVVAPLAAFPDQSVMWQAYLPATDTISLSAWEHTIRWFITSRQKCEWVDTDGDWTVDTYNWKTESSNIPFATQTFTVTKPYLIQAGTALTNSSNVDPLIDGKTLTQWGIAPPTSISSYSKTDLENAISQFVEKYKQYATLPNQQIFEDTTISWNKVPTEDVYYIDASTQWWFVKIWGSVSQPTTVIVENWDAIVEWDITWPLMLVVKNWKIKISNEWMNKRTFMEGYYFTDEWFEVIWPAITSNEILNKDPNSIIWYSDGRLVVKWVLIGKDADKVYQRRRSVLKYRFNSNYGPDYAVRNGASLTIVPNSTLWANAPVWSKDLFQMLQIDKWN